MSRFSRTRFNTALRTYGYLMTGGLLASVIIAVLGFTFVSSLRHLLWTYMMNGNAQPSLFLWLEVLLLGAAIVVLWYRIISALFAQIQERRRFVKRIEPLLSPMPQQMPNEVAHIANWHLTDEDNDYYAFTWGIAHPQIAVSRGFWAALDDSERRAVLFHEAGHVLAHDPLQQTFLRVIAHALRPFGAGMLYQRYLLQREILADRMAISACQGDDVPLLQALMVATQSNLVNHAGVGLAGALAARVSVLESGIMPEWWDEHIRYRLLSTGIAILLTLGEGLLVWCH